MRPDRNGVKLLRELAVKTRELAELSEREGTKKLWLRHNSTGGTRPLFLADQLPWNELDPLCVDEPAITDPYWKGVAVSLRREIWKKTNLSTDMVIDPYIKLPLPYTHSGYGLKKQVEELKRSELGNVTSQRMTCVINEPEDVEKIVPPVIRADEKEAERIRDEADEIFQDILPWRFTGPVMHLGAWDTIAYWMGVENCYIELMDRPGMMHAVMEKMVRAFTSEAEQYNRLGIYDTAGHYCHCSHTYRPDDDEDAAGVTGNGWAFGLAQLFTAVSPDITRDFECAYMKRVFPLFKHIYYGCCDRLDDRLDLVSALPNVRKISCSPWSDREAFAERLPKGIIMSNKPSPALLAGVSFDGDEVRRDIRRTIGAAGRFGKRLEMILKDVSTVGGDPGRLISYTRIAMEECENA